MLFRSPAYDEKSGRGTVRHVFCRRAHRTSDAVVCIVSAKGFGDKTPFLVDALREACPELSGSFLDNDQDKGAEGLMLLNRSVLKTQDSFPTL